MNDYVGPAPGPETRPALALDLSAAAAATQPGAATTAPATQPGQPLELTLRGAVLLGLENNPALRVQRLNPAIVQTAEQIEQAGFDPLLTGQLDGGQSRAPRNNRAFRRTGIMIPVTTTAMHFDSAVSQFLPTGTTVELDASTTWSKDSDALNSYIATRLGGSLTQSLLRGAGTDVNLATLRQARLDTAISQYELRGFAEALVQAIENAYWDYALAQQEIAIFTASLKVARDQLASTKAQIAVGKLATSDLAAAEQEVALRQANLINAQGLLETTRIKLVQLLQPRGPDPWAAPVALLNAPVTPADVRADVASHLAVARRWRPELNQARLLIERRDLQLVKTRNGLLPKLDFFVTLGRTGYSSSFGGSIVNLTAQDEFDALAGVKYELPIVNRDALARNRAALLGRDQAVDALANLASLVQVDVRTAYVELVRAQEQIAVSLASLRAAEEKYRAEKGRWEVGQSTNLLVAIAERDLLAARIVAVEAVVIDLRARINLYRLDGSLLERRGLAAPGRQPVVLGEKMDQGLSR